MEENIINNVGIPVKNLAEILKHPRDVKGDIYPTGFPKLDKLIGGGLKPGLHFLAGFATSGKSAMISQIALQMSEKDIPVLYFSLEMSEKEFVSRMLSFISYRMMGEKGFTANEYLMVNNYDGWSEEQKQTYRNVVDATEEATKNIYLISNIDDIMTTDIIDQITTNFIREHNKRPVVIIDCLHMIRVPDDEYLSENQRVQISLNHLKTISDKHTIAIFCTTWISQKMYDQPITLKSLKQANYIALYATTIMGLQCRGCHETWFVFTQALSKRPREMELVVLKNKNAMIGQVIKYNFDLKYSTVYENDRWLNG